ncbi:hypothetical protein E8E13_002612 [Curvularia kusanoi]|uniref:Uncharacterized protein n=1 Tax=Curvularia kusanoi TaxID=90978 RepID=A0A9P4W828_CURKU|nr:hypothetical protein E8E13_002612 [Curvularia kusanoi]
MVLQDISNQAPDSFSDNPSPSDNDPYASPNSPALADGARFDATNMPSPIPILGTFMGFSSRALRFKAETTLSFAEKKLGRTLTPSEAQALAYHIYNLEKQKSYFAAAGAVGGVYRWYATRSTYQYPFYKPKPESIDPNKFGPIKGPAAAMARQTWRFGLYVLVAGQMGNIIGQLIAQPAAAVATSQDPKLEEFGRELKAASGRDEKANSERGRLIEERRKEFEARRRQEGRGGMVPPYGGARERKQETDDADDMSPTAGNEAWGSSSSGSGSGWGEFASEDAPRPAPQQRQYRQPTAQSPSSASSSPFDADDASPTGGLFASESSSSSTSPQAPSSRPGESAWDRLRRGAAAGAPSSSQTSQTGAAPQQRFNRAGASDSASTDDFSFGGDSRQARDVERERAQREFDERLERERRGGDFNEGSEGRRW